MSRDARGSLTAGVTGLVAVEELLKTRLKASGEAVT